MKRRFWIIGLIVATAVALAIVGSLILVEPEPQINTDTQFIPVTDASAVYADAITSLSGIQDAALDVTQIRQTVINKECFTETSTQSIVYNHYGSEQLSASTDEQLSIGDYDIQFKEYYHDGAAYVTIGDSHFSSAMSAEDYQHRLTPAVLLDATLYEKIHGYDNSEQYLIYFSSPTAAESWALEADAVFVDACGSVLVDHSGQLLLSIYSTTYKQGNATIHLTVSATVTDTNCVVATPDDPLSYTAISYLDGPRMLEKASGHLMQANNLSANYNERIFCEALGDERIRNLILHSATADSWSAYVGTETTLSNTGRPGESTQHRHEEFFQNGVYTIGVDGGEPAANADISPETMKTYCLDQLLSTIMLPENITSASFTKQDSRILITFTGSESFAHQISANACQTLYQNPDILDELATNKDTDKILCYLELDAYSGLPIGAGIDYGCIYTIEGLPYQLQFTADQSYNIPNNNALTKINEAAGQ